MRAARASRGWTQEELADRVGITVQALSRIERARALPSLETVVQLSDHLGVPIDHLLRGGRDRGDKRRQELQATLLTLSSQLDDRALTLAVEQMQALVTHLAAK